MNSLNSSKSRAHWACILKPTPAEGHVNHRGAPQHEHPFLTSTQGMEMPPSHTGSLGSDMLDFNENSVRNVAVVSFYRSKAALAPYCPSKRGMIHPWDPSQATTPTGLSGANIWVAEDWLCPLSSLTLFHPLCPSLSLPSLSSDSCVFQVSLLLSPLWL